MGPRGDDAIVEGLTQLAASVACTLHVMHVLEPGKVLEVPGWPGLAEQEQALAQGPLALRRRVQYDAVLNGLPYPSERIHTHIRLGRAVETLLQACVDYDADMLIVGRHGQKGIQRLLLGSVAEQLLRQAHCPVLVARTKSYHELLKGTPTERPAPLPADQSGEHESIDAPTAQRELLSRLADER
jgi:nucleotide-binding universal stress UspA family protein